MAKIFSKKLKWESLKNNGARKKLLLKTNHFECINNDEWE